MLNISSQLQNLRGCLEICYSSGFQPLLFFAFQSQGFALGWYGIAPLALKLLE
jgi:hypothetical protein